MATVSALHLKSGHAQPMLAVPRVDAVAGHGLSGDAHAGEKIRQVLLIESETLAEFNLPPGAVRENIVVAGLELAGAAAGRRLRVGAAVLEITRDCAPCAYIESLRPGLRAQIRGRRGTLARVLTGGPIQVGDPAAWEPD